ncbi:sensor domain-containing phosphodiesterase [uncultured Pseudacidovorax sp.]|uniref:sensor domain-containing phosphodiesterase n=1 Tax=uncultured Pseudacidovorax sp. TaxID=679313 RepID=UPI0025D64D7E|nr:sensor domain-containing phosphodiesterase [uncultured Pseudacidovorax sp.]
MSPLPTDDEKQRLHSLACSNLLDSADSPAFDRITELASQIFHVPISLVSLVDADRQWFKSRFGLSIRETDRKSSFCAHAIQAADVLVIEDATKDERFFNNPLVTGSPFIRFYAGAPLVLSNGHALGTLCIIGDTPRSLNSVERTQLTTLARLTVSQIELHQQAGLINAYTRLPNRSQLFDDLGNGSLKAGAFALIEVMDHESMLNEARVVGAHVLETLIIAVSTKLKGLLKHPTTIYHVGEMRLCLALCGENRTEWEAEAQEILHGLKGILEFDTRAIEIFPTAGLVELKQDSSTPVDILRMASAALYTRHKLKRRFAWHDATADAAHQRAYRLLKDASTAIKNNEFRLVYQPKFNVSQRQFTGVEALARWKHPELGDISPAEFIPLVENGALIHEFTRWALRTALNQTRTWLEHGLDLIVAVNVSSRNLEEESFVSDLVRICQECGVSISRLHIECTETAVMTIPDTQSALAQIQNLGAEISLDDFGMGYCNLSCLRELPVKIIKIDQSLIRTIESDLRSRKFVQSLIDLGHALDYRVIAEGVESEAEFRILKHSRCDAMQGYFLSKPVEADLIEDLLSDSDRLEKLNNIG